ncbi:glyoxalase [Solimonas sp. C16B3]|uniref:Glyoxalase n=1 Tax=Solimonas marina TaxID=2714601 RepID=A0A970B974_9GAMM|nr:glyoxalase [Solimonas marina]
MQARAAPIAVGPQYDTTHVYVAAQDFDAFVEAFTATFGGKPSPRITATVTPTPSSAELQYVWTPAGTLSTFAFTTPIPYPFGQERTGYLVTDLDAALAAARRAGADVIVEPFKDPVGRDAVVEWPGGVKMQFYWHFKAPSYAALQHVPENRVYLSADRVDAFVHSFLKFSGGSVVRDEREADAAEIGRPGDRYRRIDLTSGFGAMRVIVSDGHLPYPYGHELTGYAVDDLAATLTKGKSKGLRELTPVLASGGRHSTIVEFPGGYIAELHS